MEHMNGKTKLAAGFVVLFFVRWAFLSVPIYADLMLGTCVTAAANVQYSYITVLVIMHIQ